jgi:DNA-binding XRE family transcriptional regulator
VGWHRLHCRQAEPVNLQKRRVEAEMKPEQVIAARKLLGWTKTELAERAKINRRTVINVENGKHTPSAHTLRVLQRAFESAGVAFAPGEHPKLITPVRSGFASQA